MRSKNCSGCADGAAFEMPITMAYQPIIDLPARRVYAHEALVRGAAGEGAGVVLAQVDDANRYAFDQRCRVAAITLATEIGLADTGALLSINFLPNAVYEPRACIRLTLATAEKCGFPLDRIIFEFTEVERLDAAHLLNILQSYREIGFKTAIDDFGAGYAGIGLLAQFQPDIVKLDMALIRGIDTNRAKRSIVRNTIRMLEDLGITPLCEGIETVDECNALSDLGMRLMQGYFFARPSLAALASPVFPVCRAQGSALMPVL